MPTHIGIVDLSQTPASQAHGSPPTAKTSCTSTKCATTFRNFRIVMRHGAEPWEDLAVKLMLKWPGLYYTTSAFAPKYYPRAIIEYANTRGAEKIMYAGYYPMGLSLDRIFAELPEVPFRDHVWPLFLRENAIRVFNVKAPA